MQCSMKPNSTQSRAVFFVFFLPFSCFIDWNRIFARSYYFTAVFSSVANHHQSTSAFLLAIKAKAKWQNVDQDQKEAELLIRLFLKRVTENWAHLNRSTRSYPFNTRRQLSYRYGHVVCIRRGFVDHTHIMTSSAFHRMSSVQCFAQNEDFYWIFRLNIIVNNNTTSS